ncbi:MAG: DUF4276 family protein [Clostridiales bacterium]|nr:DUF4276 family protein [Clostridiales bacterium]MCR5057461.1 DUF4276 family protein [Clostridiales bacterium]
MRVEILSEDRSGGVVLQRLTNCILKQYTQDFESYLRPHRGCGYWPDHPDEKPEPLSAGLLELLPAKLRAYDKVYAGTDIIVIVCIDSDDHDPEELMSRLKDTCRRYARDLSTVIAISVEEMESWILADKNAILLAYPEADLKRLSEYEQDSICGTWEVLCDVLLREQSHRIKKIGYPAIGQYKATWAEKISKYMLPGNNVSPSFKKFELALTGAVKKVLNG